MAHSASELDPPSPYLPDVRPRDLDLLAKPLDGCCSPPQAPSVDIGYAADAVYRGPASIPLHPAPTTNSMSTQDIQSVIRVILNCVVMVTMLIASTEAVEAYTARRKQKRRRDEGDASSLHQSSLRHCDSEEDALEVPHVRQVCDLVAWHIGVEDARCQTTIYMLV
jgi:hypothetical protein